MTAPTIRRDFLKSSAGLVASVAAINSVQANEDSKDGIEEEHQRLKSDLVHRFVKVAHSSLPQVKALLAEDPRLIRAAWDWGEGDFETALGAASHTGNAPIAMFLLENGSPIDLFAATMLGKIDIVRTTLDAYPDLINVAGPHGIPLIQHARSGVKNGGKSIRANAKEVLAYLEEVIEQSKLDAENK